MAMAIIAAPRVFHFQRDNFDDWKNYVFSSFYGNFYIYLLISEQYQVVNKKAIEVSNSSATIATIKVAITKYTINIIIVVVHTIMRDL